jgi:hypothetical protein
MSFRTYYRHGAALLFALGGLSSSVHAQKVCGQELIIRNLKTQSPEQYQKIQNKYLEDMDAIALVESGQVQARTNATTPIPVVFHFVITGSQHSTLGRDSGIMRRVVSQLKVLNQDFNRQNPDSTAIPAPFKSRYGNPQIKFARAGARKYPGYDASLPNNAYSIAAGVEVKILSNATTFNADDMGAAAKDPTTGLAAWDPTKYLNIWIVRITSSGAGSILGVTTPPYLNGFNVGGHTVTPNDYGVVMSYGAFGKREFPLQYFFGDADRGRTFTHEIGHFFELIHIWGDDDNADTVTRCSILPGGYDDDLINDTPPQGKRTYCDFPNHLSTNCPTFPLLDKCSPVSPGVMFMNYMDYVVDSAMHMFTVNQATRMNFYLGTESVGLTQHPELLGVDDAKPELGNIAILPNPSSGSVQLDLEQTDGFRGAVVMNMMGQTIKNIIAVPGVKTYNFDLSSAPRGIYLVQCRYDGGTITQKLVLE